MDEHRTKPKDRRWLVLLTGLAVLAAAGILAFDLIAGAEPGPPAPGVLLAPGRTHLSLCVDGAGARPVVPADSDRVRAAVDEALARLPNRPPEIGEPSVVSGCPPPIDLTRALEYVDLCCRLSIVVRDTSALSPHRLFIYFAPNEAYTQAFGERPFARVSAERYKESRDLLPEMTVALYFPDSADTTTIASGILRGLALDRPTPEPTLEPDVFFEGCRQGTPIAGCDRYFLCITPTPVSPCDDFWEEIGVEPPQ